jgi:hypothetical protein
MTHSTQLLGGLVKALCLAFVAVLLASCAFERRADRPEILRPLRNLEIFVADRGKSRIVRFTDMNGTGWQVRTTAAGRTFGQPTGVFAVKNSFVFGSNGIYVADRLNNRIVRMPDMGTGSAQEFPVPGLATPFRVTVDLGAIFFTSAPNRLHRINGIDGSGHVEIRGTDIRVLDAAGAPAGTGVGFADVGLAVVGGRGRGHGIYLPASSQIVQLNSMSPDIGTPPTRFSALQCCTLNGGGAVFQTATGAGSDPLGIDIDSAKRIWVADTKNHRIVRVDDMSGAGMVVLGGPASGSGTNQFNEPTAIQVHETGIYIADSRNNRIVRIQDIDGTGWTTFSGPSGDGFQVPWDVAVVSGF